MQPAEKLVVLGTGNAMATKCYNTCFALQSSEGTILVDAGGGNGIFTQLEKAGIPITDIHEMIVTHAHTDHLLGVIWIIRKVTSLMLSNGYDGLFHIHCSEAVEEALRVICRLTLAKKFTNLFGDGVRFERIADQVTHPILQYQVTFFDIHSTKMEQHGFTLRLQNGRVLTCMGDEPFNPICRPFVENSDWLLSEAFCLYNDRDRFKPYEKHHSTVKDACELAERLHIGHLVLWHTEDRNYPNRQKLYLDEGRSYFHGDLYVPYDLDILEL